MPAPRTWAEIVARLAYLLGGGEAGTATALDLLRAAVAADYGVESLHDLRPDQRALARQRAALATYELEGGDGDLAFYPSGVRTLVCSTLARHFRVAAVEGPGYRLDPSEIDRPTWEEQRASADFDGPAD